MCGNYNKHGSKACSEHIVREAELISAILKDISGLVSLINRKSYMNTIESKVQKQAAKRKIKYSIKTSGQL
ncbi:hypothetical protein [Bacillus toyonensis]|uniref:hypothetical protein n=1 Tax=Bacillus toyonensis TaxID=155322 RepID=UPI00352B28C4